MKRSINSENIIVALSIAIAISLLTSACGRNGMKTLKTNEILSKPTDAPTTQDKIIQSEIQRKTQSGNVVNVSDSAELANRIHYIQYKEFDANVGLTFLVTTKEQKTYFVQFTNAHQMTEDGKTIIFSSNQSKQMESLRKLGESVVRLPYVARVEKIEPGLATIAITETSVINNETKAKKSTEVSATVKLSSADATVESSDTELLKMTDAKISTRITQLFVVDESSPQRFQLLDSKANRIVVNVDSKDGSELYSFYGLLNANSNSAILNVNRISEKLNSDIFSKYKMSLTSGKTIIESDIISLTFEDKKSQQRNNVILNLSSKDSTKAEDAAEEKATEEVEQTDDSSKTIEDNSEDQQEATPSTSERKFEYYTEAPTEASTVKKADFSKVKTSIKTTATIVKKEGKENTRKTEDQQKTIKPFIHYEYKSNRTRIPPQ